MAEKYQTCCGFCGGVGKKHLKHCPVPKLSKEQVNWIGGVCMKHGYRFPLR